MVASALERFRAWPWRAVAAAVAAAAALALPACGHKHHSTVSTSTSTFTVGGSVTGLSASGSGLVLQLNGTTNLAVSAGASSYSLPALASGSAYNVTVQTQPTSPSQTCTVANPVGTVAGADVTNVNVSCTTNSFIVGGTVSGLSGTGLILQLNGGPVLAITSSLSFSFSSNPVLSGSSYSVTVQTQPTSPAQTCTVSPSSGTVGNTNVSNVQVNCVTNPVATTYTIGGSIAGLTASGLVLQLNGANNINVTASATSFTFSNSVAGNTNYGVTVLTQPTGQTCTVANGTGTVGSANVTNVQLTCATNTYSVGGTVSGLAGSGMVLRLNGGNDLSISANGTYAFASVAAGSPYTVSVATPPYSPSQTCTVTNGSGTVSSSNVTNVNISCSTNSFTVSGTVSGLSGSGLVLQNNGGDNLAISGNGSFTFVTPVASGATYAVSVATAPSLPTQTCTIAYPSGTVGNMNVTNVAVTCSTNTYTVGGSVTGLTGTGLKLQLNGSNDLTISANGGFTFSSPVASGTNYSVTVLTQPTLQTCVVTSGSGTIGSAAVGNVQVSCGAVSWNGTKQFGSPTDDIANSVATDSNGNVYVAGCFGRVLVNTDQNFKATCSTAGSGAGVYVRKYNSTGVLQWERSLGTSNNGEANGVATDASGNVYVTGFVYGDFDGQTAIGGKDIFLVKVNSSGTKQWSVQYGSGSDDQGNAVATDGSGNVYVVGTSYGSVDSQTNNGFNDVFVTKFDASGNRTWTVEQGTTANDYGLAIAIDGSGNPYISGTTLGGMSGSNQGAEDVFVAKLDLSTGAALWTTQIGTSTYDYNAGVAVDASGNLYVAGYTGGSLPGFTNPVPGALDLFVAKVNLASCTTSCSLSWIQQNIGGGSEYATGVAANSGGVFVVGNTYGNLDGNTNADSSGQTADIFVSYFNSAGTWQWTREIGTASTDKVYAATTDSAGSVYTTGFSLGALDGNVSNGGADIVVLKYAADGIRQ